MKVNFMRISISIFIYLIQVVMALGGASAMANSEEHRARVGELTNHEQMRIDQRVQSLNLWSIAFGPASDFNMNNNHLQYALTLGHHWEVNENAEIRVTAHTTLPSQGVANWASYSSLGIGGSWLASTADVSPILGGEIGYGYASIPHLSDKSGISTGAHAGVRLFRTATAQMGIEAYAKTLLAAAGSTPPLDYGATLSVLY
jgi:hypothetical protein